MKNIQLMKLLPHLSQIICHSNNNYTRIKKSTQFSPFVKIITYFPKLPLFILSTENNHGKFP